MRLTTTANALQKRRLGEAQAARVLKKQRVGLEPGLVGSKAPLGLGASLPPPSSSPRPLWPQYLHTASYTRMYCGLVLGCQEGPRETGPVIVLSALGHDGRIGRMGERERERE